MNNFRKPENNEYPEIESFIPDMEKFLEYFAKNNNEKTTVETIEGLRENGALKGIPFFISIINTEDGYKYDIGESNSPLKFTISSDFEMPPNDVTVEVENNPENLTEEDYSKLITFIEKFQETKGDQTILNFVKDEIKRLKEEDPEILRVREYVKRTGNKTLAVFSDFVSEEKSDKNS